MTDGTTGINVAPVSEDEMNNIRSIFERAANSIVNVSHLHTQVQELAAQVQALKGDVEYYRDRTNQQDAELVYIRGQRDDALREAKALKEAHEVDQIKLGSAHDRIVDLVKELATVVTEKNNISRQRDDAELRVMALEDIVTESEQKLADIRDFAKNLFGLGEKPSEEKPSDPIPFPTPSVSPQPASFNHSSEDRGAENVAQPPVKEAWQY